MKLSGIYVLLLVSVLCVGSEQARAADSKATSALSPLEQALTHITSEDEAVREAALRTVTEQGDNSLIPRLEEIRAKAEAIRQAEGELTKARQKYSEGFPEDGEKAVTEFMRLIEQAYSWLK